MEVFAVIIPEIDGGRASGSGGDKGSRTPDLLNAIETLYQLSYIPVVKTANSIPNPRAGCKPQIQIFWAWSRPMYSQGAFDAQRPQMKRMPYQTCERKTPSAVRSHISGCVENAVRSVSSK